MITLRWAPFPGSSVSSYHVYRSMIGFTIIRPINPSLLSGQTLVLRANGKAVATTVTFSGSADLASDINAVAQGFRAYDSVSDPQMVFVRSEVREAPGSLQIVGGTSLATLNLSAHTITEKSEDLQIASVPANPDPEAMLEFQDADGVIQDWYAITTIDPYMNESRKSNYKQPITSSGPVCSIEGIITDLQGIRVPDAEISAQLVQFPCSPEVASHVTLAPIVTRTGSDGRFSIVLLQGALVELKIPAIGYAHNIKVPEKSYVFITDLKVDLDYQFPLEYRDDQGTPSTNTGVFA